MTELRALVLFLVALTACYPSQFGTYNRPYNPSNGCMSIAPSVVQCSSADPNGDGARYCITFRDDHGGWRVVCTDKTERM